MKNTSYCASMLICLCLTMTLAVRQSAEAAPLVIAEEGVALATIVKPTGATNLESFAAQVMANSLNTITGGTFQIISDTGGPYAQPVISIGRTSLGTGMPMQGEAWMQSNPEAFRILRQDNALIICGNQSTGTSEFGTMWGVYAFLEMQGVGSYLFDPLGDVFPSKPSLSLDEIDLTDAPAFEMRNSSETIVKNYQRHLPGGDLYGQPMGDLQWFNRQAAAYRNEFYHMYQSVITPQVRAEHSEWFLDTLPDIGVDLTRPEIRNLFIQYLSARFSQNPDLRVASICPDDYILSDRCWSAEYLRQLGLSAPPSDTSYGTQSASDLHINFVNAVAEGLEAQFPDRKLITYAYIDYIDPPTVTRVHPNVIIMIAPLEEPRRDELHSTLTDIIQGWKDMGAQQLFWYGYNLGRTPVPHLFGEWFRKHVRSGIEGVYYEGHSIAALSGLNYWLTAKLMWNPEADVGKLTDEFCMQLFGPDAGDLMRKAFIAWETDPATAYDVIPQLLSAAQAAAGDTSSDRGKRVRLFKLGYELWRSSYELDGYLKLNDIPNAIAAAQACVSTSNTIQQEYPGWGQNQNVRLYNVANAAELNAWVIPCLQRLQSAPAINRVMEAPAHGSVLCLTNNADIAPSRRMNTGVTVTFNLAGGDTDASRLFDGQIQGSDHIVVKYGSWGSSMTLDLKKAYQLDRVELCAGMTEGYRVHQKQYGNVPVFIEIEVSTNGSTWTMVDRMLPRTLRGWSRSGKLLKTARYVRISTFGMELAHEYNEVRVWGMGGAAPGDLLVLSNDAGTRGVYQYNYASSTGMQDAATEKKIVDLAAVSTATDITYGPDSNLYVAAGNVIKRYSGYTGAFIDDYLTHASAMRNIAFSPAGKAYVSIGKSVYEKQPNGTLSLYSTTSATSIIYRMVWGPDNTGDGKADLYVITDLAGSGVYVIGSQGDPGTLFAMPPSGYGIYQAFCFGPDITGDGIPELFGQGEYSGLQVAVNNGDTGASLGYFTDNTAAYATDMRWDLDGNLYIANRVHGDVKVYNSDGSFNYSFYVAGSTPVNNKAYALEVAPVFAGPFGSISGQIALEDYSGDLQYVLVKVELRNPGETTPVRTEKVLLDSQGNYSISGVAPGTYDLAFRASSWLQQVVPNVEVLTYQTSTGVNVSLPNGDANGDNEVTVTGDMPVTLKNMDKAGDP